LTGETSIALVFHHLSAFGQLAGGGVQYLARLFGRGRTLEVV
jgi:hypothetical protein